MNSFFSGLILSGCGMISIGVCAQHDSGVKPDTLYWDLTALNTGQQVSYLSPFEKEVLLELNKVRSDPKGFAQLYIAPLISNYDGNLDTRNHIETREGASALKECIAVLNKTKKLELLMPDKELSAVAFRHTSKQSKTRQTGHTSPNGETFEQRMRKISFSKTGECISYGEDQARGIVISLLVDDGVPSRGHRKIILDPGYSSVGIAAGAHEVYANMCTLDFGGGTRRK
jgi:uncharacterized protein YkwD